MGTLTGKLTGFFDVRDYKAGVSHENMPMKAEGAQIAFNVLFKQSECPQELAEFCKPYEKNGMQYVIVKFKIGNKCKWYDADAQLVDKPSNVDLDGVRYNVVIDYVALHGDASKKEASGFWAHNIQFEQAIENPFQPMGGAATSGEKQKAPEQAPEQASEQATEGKLPF